MSKASSTAPSPQAEKESLTLMGGMEVTVRSKSLSFLGLTEAVFAILQTGKSVRFVGGKIRLSRW